MNLFRFKLRPRSPWRTPWQADTLAGLLCVTCARMLGAEVLRKRLIEPMLAGGPPFVLSDACPGDLLPAPVSIRLLEWPVDSYKIAKKARWIAPAAFDRLRRGEQPGATELLPELHRDDELLLTHARQHNTLSRLSDTTGEAESGLGLFSRPDFHLRTHRVPGTPNPLLDGADYLSLYVRVASPEALDLVLDLLGALAQTGFGADVATGRGQFDIVGGPEPMPGLDWAPDNANAVVCLSTFQPGPADPTDGLWEAFPKFGKLGPDLCLDEVRKRTLILFRPGACFRASSFRPHLGRAVPMDQVLPAKAASALRARGIDVIHPAFGLALPATLDWNPRT